jgi:hypothetical protein
MIEMARVNGVYCPPLIGLAGPAGVGKTTMAKKLVGELGYRRKSFATPIKQMLRKMGVPYEFLYDDKLADIPGLNTTGRHLLQTLGTDWGRNMVDPNIWVYAAKQGLDEAKSRHPRYRAVFDDVRFNNEAEFINAEGGIVISLDRPGVAKDDSHVSEAGVDPSLIHTHLHVEGPLFMLAAIHKTLAAL